MKRQPLVLFGPADMLRMLVECLENGMCLSGMVRNVCRCPIVVPMNIRHDILRATLLRPIVLFDRDRTTNTRMILRPVDRTRGHMSDTGHFPNPDICRAGTVLCNRLLSVHLDLLSLQCDRQCLDILSIAIDPFPIGMCLVDMQRMCCSFDQSMCQQHMELKMGKMIEFLELKMIQWEFFNLPQSGTITT